MRGLLFNIYLTQSLSSKTLVLTEAFSKLRTPRGQTAEQTPQPTHEERTISCPFWAYARTSIPISQNVEQFPQEMH